ncbi:MAG: tocopherol cyclase family protein [Oscillospiraceae bacterium]|nr:tocopherol cyclase family protein [Oscillospiraceae bacterium]
MSARFEGWYYKHQAGGKSLAVIPGRARDHAFVQIVTNDDSYYVNYPLAAYHRGDTLRIGENSFSRSGVRLDIDCPEVRLFGEVRYGALTSIRGDIMGPFRYVPMECRHGVISMDHGLAGTLTLNGVRIDFTGGRGYIESDSGRSFPGGYTWVQCNAFGTDCSIMAAVARIPFCGIRFWGHIAVVRLDGREYRLATYNGGRIVRAAPGIVELRRGKYRLSIAVDSHEGLRLPAPRSGEMTHTIREAISCPAHFRFTEGERVLFEERSKHASYEYEMEEPLLG